MRSGVFGIYIKCDNDGRVLCSIIRYHWVGSGTVAFVRYRIVGAGTVILGVSVDDSGSVFRGILH